MSDSIKDNYIELVAFADFLKKEGVEKAIKDKKESRVKAINRLKFGLFFAIISPFVGIPMGVFLLNMTHKLLESINQFK
jgi:hypothetical protein